MLLPVLKMIALPYVLPTAYNMSGTMGLLVFLSAIVLVTMDHALENILAERYA